MARAKATVRGDRETIANFRRVRQVLSPTNVTNDMVAALEPMKERTQENAKRLRNYPGKHPGWPQPKGQPRGGHLDEGVVVVKRRATSARAQEVWLTFAKRSRKIAHLVEFGTAPHYQPNRRAMHPGAAPQPFARPAFEATKYDVVENFGERTWRRIAGAILPVRTK